MVGASFDQPEHFVFQKPRIKFTCHLPRRCENPVDFHLDPVLREFPALYICLPRYFLTIKL